VLGYHLHDPIRIGRSKLTNDLKFAVRKVPHIIIHEHVTTAILVTFIRHQSSSRESTKFTLNFYFASIPQHDNLV